MAICLLGTLRGRRRQNPNLALENPNLALENPNLALENPNLV
jgi:hypothetical protein